MNTYILIVKSVINKEGFLKAEKSKRRKKVNDR
jgi:hypothetical protein